MKLEIIYETEKVEGKWFIVRKVGPL